MKKKLLAALAGTIVSAALLIGGVQIYNYIEQSIPLETVITEQYGERMIDFELPDMAGNSIQVTASSGKPKLINFWASWCPGCKSEAEDLNHIYSKYKEEIDIISVNVTTEDSVEEAQAFLEAYDVQMPTLLDREGIVSAQYRITAIPTNFFVRADGTIGQITYELTKSGAEPFIQELLGQ
ncbi:TlpA family protein disulfide reductase [Paenibacillus harenae]|uniref:TlpA family protein disulfide reductase n=1 Tax=Paenibacillus harenae TaxID=306543 RepID=UPI00278CC68F|nr:TlpA disulfide reductase family protein [Paenibacillus harenae]MDQ0063586.1 peroxiredoxin [Paenibacillus harenae]